MDTIREDSPFLSHWQDKPSKDNVHECYLLYNDFVLHSRMNKISKEVLFLKYRQEEISFPEKRIYEIILGG